MALGLISQTIFGVQQQFLSLTIEAVSHIFTQAMHKDIVMPIITLITTDKHVCSDAIERGYFLHLEPRRVLLSWSCSPKLSRTSSIL